MALVRKARIVASSLIITIPRQLADAYGIKNGDMIEIIPINFGELKLRKVN